MSNDDGSPNTAHTNQPVPFFFIDNTLRPKLIDGKLGDVAPTILKLLNVSLPDEMTGEVLFSTRTDEIHC
jgi:2,3-bisphosphoglycerate-independent phosphoglycerate mutase